MKKIIDVLSEPIEKKTDHTNGWLDFEEVVETKDCKKCNGTGWIEVEEIEERRGVARVVEKAIYTDDPKSVKETLNVAIYKEFNGTRHFYLKEVLEQSCDCVLKKRANDLFIMRMEKTGLMNEVKRKTFKTYIADNDKRKEIKNKCFEFSNEPQALLALLGQTGAGKTHLGTATVFRLVQSGLTASYVEWKKEMNLAKDDYYKVKSEKLEEWKNVDVLYIDDLFKHKNNNIEEITDKEFDFGWEIINTRLARDKITIISSELSLNDFYKIDEGTAGRIKMSAGKYLIDVKKDIKMNYRLKDNVGE